MNFLLPTLRIHYILTLIIGLSSLFIMGLLLPFGMTANTQSSHASRTQSELSAVGNDPPSPNRGTHANHQSFVIAKTQPNALEVAVLGVYEVGNVSHYMPLAISLPGLDLAYPATNSNRPFFQFYTVADSGQFVADADGSAHVTQHIVNRNGDGFVLHLDFNGWRDSLPNDQNPLCLTLECPDRIDWNYYTELSGTLTGLPNTRYANAILALRNTARSSAQVGTNAHLYAPHDRLGGAAQLVLELIQPPSTGIVLQSHLSDVFYHFTLDALSAADNSAQTSTEIEFANVSQDTCQFYPLGLRQRALTGINVGGELMQLPIGAAEDDLAWLAWQEKIDLPSFFVSLTPPGTSSQYLNPDNKYDQALSINDWVAEYVPAAVEPDGATTVLEEALTQLGRQPFVVPIWDRARARMGRNYYRIVGFATVRLLDYQLAKQATAGEAGVPHHLSLQFDGYAFHCNPTALSTATTSIELIEQTNHTWTYQVIGGGASQWNLGIADCLAFIDAIVPANSVQIGMDEVTGFIGLRWRLANDFRHGQFSVTFDRPVASGAINVLARHGSLTATAKLRGPNCRQ